MQIDVEFEVFKALTLLRREEGDSYSDVIQRLLKLAENENLKGGDRLVGTGNFMGNLLRGRHDAKDGAWIGNVFFPNGTQFRATYKGKTFRAEIRNEVWVGEDGITRQSPSDAAGSISGTKVNGWRFWYGLRPGEVEWHRLDEFRK